MAITYQIFSGITRSVIEDYVDEAENEALQALFPVETHMNIDGNILLDRDVVDVDPDPDIGNYPDAIKYFRIDIMNGTYVIDITSNFFTAQSTILDTDDTPTVPSNHRTFHIEFDNHKLSVGSDHELFGVSIKRLSWSSPSLSGSSSSDPANTLFTDIDRYQIIFHLRQTTTLAIVKVINLLDSWHIIPYHDNMPGNGMQSSKVGELARQLHLQREKINRAQLRASLEFGYLRDENEKIEAIAQDIQSGILN